MEFANKKLLILAGASLHCKVVEAAQEMGIITIVTDNNPDAPAKKIADKCYDVDVKDVDGLVELCRREQVDGVISVCIDFAQPYYRQLCTRTQLPCWGNDEQFATLTQKSRFKQACAACGVDVIPSYSPAVFLSAVPFDGYPVLVKPSQNRGSRGMAVCHDRQEVLQAMEVARACSADGDVVIERYMGGKPDFQVTYLVVEGVPYVVRTADRFLGDAAAGLERVAIALSSPSAYTTLYFEQVHPAVERLVTYLGIQNAPLFFQGFVDGDRIRFYDPGMRFPGGDYDRIFAQVMGQNLMKSLIALALGEKMTFPAGFLGRETASLRGNTIFTLHSTLRAGEIGYLTPVEDITAIEGVCYATYRHRVGERVKPTGDVNRRILETNIVGANPAAVAKTVQQVQQTLRVTDAAGENMIVCAFDAEGWANNGIDGCNPA